MIITRSLKEEKDGIPGGANVPGVFCWCSALKRVACAHRRSSPSKSAQLFE